MEDEGFEPLESAPTATLVMEEEFRPQPARRPVRERSAAGVNQIVGIHSTLTKSEVMIIEPKSFEDALDVVQSLRDRRAVIMNMKELDAEQAQRLLDFVSGATHALDGHQKQIGEGSADVDADSKHKEGGRR